MKFIKTGLITSLLRRSNVVSFLFTFTKVSLNNHRLFVCLFPFIFHNAGDNKTDFPAYIKSKGTGHTKFVQRGTTLSGDTTYLMNVTNKILLALKFELTHKYSDRVKSH